MYLSASAVAGKPDTGAITSVRPLPLPLQGTHKDACSLFNGSLFWSFVSSLLAVRCTASVSTDVKERAVVVFVFCLPVVDRY